MDASLSPIRTPVKFDPDLIRQDQQDYIDREKTRGCRMSVKEFLQRGPRGNDNGEKLKR